jgi:3-oxo-5-alpha-steroid 4-dehydrogenase 1
MTEPALYNILIMSALLSAATAFVLLFFVTAPYGRHSRPGWGPTLGNRLGWLLMESAAPIVFLVCYVIGNNRGSVTALLFLGMWELHYIHRAFLFPFSIRGSAKRMSALVIAMGFVFNGANAYLNGRYLFLFSGGYSSDWLFDPRFLVGAALFVLGFVVNRQADRTLQNLKSLNAAGYGVPHGGMYRWISCPNYCGEIAMWSGWAIATWSVPGLVFALWTAANLVPRARSHQQWYRHHFPDYPPERKALVPLLW